jgi:hypothetical protein
MDDNGTPTYILTDHLGSEALSVSTACSGRIGSTAM